MTSRSGHSGRVSTLRELFVLVSMGDHQRVTAVLDVTPSLVTVGLARSDEFFLAEWSAQIYQGATSLHIAGFSYNAEMARELIARGAGCRAKDRRGAEPLHAATMGAPGNSTWNPRRQQEVISCLIEAGADPNAAAVGGVTPLHRAVRNRCSAAVETLLRAGADPGLRNKGGSTPADLAHWPTGRGGSGAAAAKAEQRAILELLNLHHT